MKIPLTLISALCSTFLLQMNEVLPQFMKKTSSRELILHHYNDENLLMDNFYITNHQEDTFNHIVMEYLQLLILMKKPLLERANRWYVKPRCMIWFTNLDERLSS